MTRMFIVGLMTVAAWFASAGAAEAAGRYAIVVKKGVAAGPWGKVVRFLAAKHKGEVFAYDKSPEDIRKAVGAYHPRYVCFVCPPTENFPDFALVANKFCRTLDDDPYVDAIWGILTGFDEEHALEVAKAEPVVIRRAFTKTLGAWLNWVPEGDYVTEWTRDRGERGVKKAGEAFAVRSGGPTNDADDARYVHKLLSGDKFDLIIGSGHGGHHDWMLMYPSQEQNLPIPRPVAGVPLRRRKHNEVRELRRHPTMANPHPGGRSAPAPQSGLSGKKHGGCLSRRSFCRRIQMQGRQVVGSPVVPCSGILGELS